MCGRKSLWPSLRTEADALRPLNCHLKMASVPEPLVRQAEVLQPLNCHLQMASVPAPLVRQAAVLQPLKCHLQMAAAPCSHTPETGAAAQRHQFRSICSDLFLLPATPEQRQLYLLAIEVLSHNRERRAQPLS
jgi:hypothetical protein